MTFAHATLITSTYRLNGKDAKIHAITTGLISEITGIKSKSQIYLGFEEYFKGWKSL